MAKANNWLTQLQGFWYCDYSDLPLTQMQGRWDGNLLLNENG